MSVKVLKKYINEVLRVTVQRVEASVDGEKEKTSYTKTFDINDDDADELDWFLDNYGKPPLNLKKKSRIVDPVTKKKEYYKVYDDVSELQISEVLNELQTIAETANETLDTNLLSNVIRPWGDQGFKALKYILVYSRRTKKPFPFFMLQSVTTGSSIDLSTVDVSKNLFDHLMNVTPRIGKNDTGQGEFIIALLTGGIAGGTGLYGDLEIGEDNWEVKVPSSSGVVRLGDLSSGVFRKKLKGFVENNSEVKRATNADEILDMCANRESYEENIIAKKYFKIRDVINTSTKAMLDEMKITGFALFFPNEKRIEFVGKSIKDWKFFTSGGKSSGRIHIQLKK